MAQQLIGTKYKDMDPAYQESVDKAEYLARRNAQRQAAERVTKFKAAGEEANSEGQFDPHASAFNVDKLEDFDLRATGAGGTFNKMDKPGGFEMEGENGTEYGRGRARLSRKDAKGLLESGKFTAEQIMEYGNNLGEGAIFGQGAQKFLQKKIAELKAGGGTNPSEGSTTPEETGGGTTEPPPTATEPIEELTPPIDFGGGDGNMNVNKEYETGDVTIHGDMNGGIIDTSINDHSITINGGGSGPGGHMNPVTSMATGIGVMRQIDGYSDTRTKHQPYEMSLMREEMTGANDLINDMHQSSHNIIKQFGHHANLTGWGLNQTLGEIAKAKVTPAEKIEPTWDDDDDD